MTFQMNHLSTPGTVIVAQNPWIGQKQYHCQTQVVVTKAQAAGTQDQVVLKQLTQVNVQRYFHYHNVWHNEHVVIKCLDVAIADNTVQNSVNLRSLQNLNGLINVNAKTMSPNIYFVCY